MNSADLPTINLKAQNAKQKREFLKKYTRIYEPFAYPDPVKSMELLRKAKGQTIIVAYEDNGVFMTTIVTTYDVLVECQQLPNLIGYFVEKKES